MSDFFEALVQRKIALAVDIARHLRDEAGQMLDHEFDTASGPAAAPVSLATASPDSAACGCSPTAKGNACCYPKTMSERTSCTLASTANMWIP